MKDGEHTYYPDFIMNNIIYEVKGREYRSIKEKNEAVIKNGYQIILFRRLEIEPIIKIVKENYQVKNLLDLYDKVS